MAKEAERFVEERKRKKRNRKKTLGRQKIEMKPIQCLEARHLSFSELRIELFEKAIKLCARTGARLAIVAFSPAGEPYSFAHPSVNAVIERYCDPSPSAAAPSSSEAATTTILCGFDRERKRLCKAIAAEARRRDELDAAARAATSDDVPGPVAMLAALERVQAEVAQRAQEMFAEGEESMVQWYAAQAARGAGDSFDYYLGDGSLAADGGGWQRQSP